MDKITSPCYRRKTKLDSKSTIELKLYKQEEGEKHC